MMPPQYNRPSPGAAGLSKPKSQPAHAVLGAHQIGGSKTKLKTYGGSSFAGRPLAGPARQPNKRGMR